MANVFGKAAVAAREKTGAGGVLAALLSGLAACLSPPRCRLCRSPLLGYANPFLCSACLPEIEWIGRGACRGCGFPAGPHARLGRDCTRCRGKNLGLTAAAAVARYRRGVRELILSLKFGGDTEIAGLLAGLMAERLRTADFLSPDLIIPVSLHPERRRRRGFDQARLIGRRLSRETGLPLGEDWLRRIRPTRPQASLDRFARSDNVQGAFAASPEMAGKRVLLVDDVMTTGATLRDAARACRESGAGQVYALAFAR